MSNELNTADLVARLERLEAENRRLANQVERLTGPARLEPMDTESEIPRRGMLKRVGAVALGATALTAAGQVAGAPSAAAADGQALILGRSNSATSATFLSADIGDYTALYIQNFGPGGQRTTKGIQASARDYGVLGTGQGRAGVIGLFPAGYTDDRQIDQAGVGGVGARGAVGVLGVSDSADAVLGRSTGTAGVHGNCQNDSGIGVFGDGSYGAVGVYGHSGSNHGVLGIANSGRGLAGLAVEPSGTGVLGIAVAESGQAVNPAAVTGTARDAIAVQAVSDANNAVVGRSGSARGGVFSGGAAAVRLSPGTSATPPTSGQTGDLYVDSTGRLWYCRQGGGTATWVNLA